MACVAIKLYISCDPMLSVVVLRHMPRQRLNSSIIYRSLVVGGRRTTFGFEPDLWDALEEIANREQFASLSELVRDVAKGAAVSSGSTTSAVRVAIVRYFRQAANERPPRPEPGMSVAIRLASQNGAKPR